MGMLEFIILSLHILNLCMKLNENDNVRYSEKKEKRWVGSVAGGRYQIREGWFCSLYAKLPLNENE